MTKDDVIRMAREAGLSDGVAETVAFANLVAAAEREACAEVCEAQDEYGDVQYAKAIRARRKI